MNWQMLFRLGLLGTSLMRDRRNAQEAEDKNQELFDSAESVLAGGAGNVGAAGSELLGELIPYLSSVLSDQGLDLDDASIARMTGAPVGRAPTDDQRNIYEEHSGRIEDAQATLDRLDNKPRWLWLPGERIARRKAEDTIRDATKELESIPEDVRLTLSGGTDVVEDDNGNVVSYDAETGEVGGATGQLTQIDPETGEEIDPEAQEQASVEAERRNLRSRALGRLDSLERQGIEDIEEDFEAAEGRARMNLENRKLGGTTAATNIIVESEEGKQDSINRFRNAIARERNNTDISLTTLLEDGRERAANNLVDRVSNTTLSLLGLDQGYDANLAGLYTGASVAPPQGNTGILLNYFMNQDTLDLQQQQIDAANDPWNQFTNAFAGGLGSGFAGGLTAWTNPTTWYKPK